MPKISESMISELFGILSSRDLIKSGIKPLLISVGIIAGLSLHKAPISVIAKLKFYIKAVNIIPLEMKSSIKCSDSSVFNARIFYNSRSTFDSLIFLPIPKPDSKFKFKNCLMKVITYNL
jgi:hypothetical protein